MHTNMIDFFLLCNDYINYRLWSEMFARQEANEKCVN